MQRREFLKAMGLAAAATTMSASLTEAAFAATMKIKPGGRMVVTYKSDPGTLDPAIGYNWQNWPMMRALFSRLVTYEPGTTKLILDAAESYHVSDDGTEYTFKLRPGLKFGDGSALTAADVVFSINRVVDPATASPGQSFFSPISGYDDFVNGKAKQLAGVKALDAQTVQFKIDKPNVVFLQVLAMNFASIVSAKAVAEHSKDVAHHPMGSGPFRMTSWKPGNEVVFEKNPHYFIPGIPYLDEVRFTLGIDSLTAYFKLLRGEVDLLGDGVPGSQLALVKHNPKYRGMLVEGHPLETSYITMNTQIKPFDDVRVRRAINMAIDKPAIVRAINGRGKPANQILPPGMPGYDPKYKGYAYDPAAAMKLLAEAGHAGGFETELYAMNSDPNPRIAQAIQAQLSKIGVKLKLHILSQAQVIAIAGTPGKAPMVWSGGLAWVDDFPDPSDFYGPILGSGSAVKGGWNWAFYKNPKLDKLAAEADGMYKADEHEKRLALYREIFSDVMHDAPWVPVFNQVDYTMHSKNIEGRPGNVFADPGVYPFTYSRMFSVKAQG
ncbi:ABC transporter substrate-binding protein [Acidihalobacter prosperus]|uniref:Dipeptide-binding ABC transporter, periplasmic substrate-binding component n=1 Tax=Acidihalobacter prosperus TaxID=160660 RepID=A0A1A6C8Y5_9GAMM|nr:ABC transporter substrate-binding protein [Acidihalobacter prosperus]OBS11009.1 Dipeptide-binding ABC transporter, periplasmic substrate-binding component [Acidihalobacter prosperus]